jgi:hypothetical protein
MLVRSSIYLFLCLVLTACTTTAPSGPAARQQEEANLVVNFQSWNSISFIKPDITGTAGTLTVRPKTFTREGVVKLLRNLKVPRDFVVVVLDRRHEPDPMVAKGGMDGIQDFFQGLGFRRIVIQDGSAFGRTDGTPILPDTTAPAGPGSRATKPAAGA